MPEKPEAAPADERPGVTFFNRGQRTFDLGAGRRHAPGTNMYYNADEAADHAGYPDLIDVTKNVAAVAPSVRQLESEKKNLLDENAALKAQLAALDPKFKAEPEAEAEPAEQAA